MGQVLQPGVHCYFILVSLQLTEAVVFLNLVEQDWGGIFGLIDSMFKFLY